MGCFPGRVHRDGLPAEFLKKKTFKPAPEVTPGVPFRQCKISAGIKKEIGLWEERWDLTLKKHPKQRIKEVARAPGL